MQTSGATLLATKRRCLVRVLMAVHDGRSAYGLLYLIAVRDDCGQEARQTPIDSAVWYSADAKWSPLVDIPVDKHCK